ncbi:MAG: hypothetical protein JO047_11685, partial [Alphaproteobacteria bacterium]|nr:hypothetical protein [Alphaproteobacteria bacterium]
GGGEAIRGIAYLVRDRNWGTYAPAVEDLRIDQGADRFTVSYDAICRDAEQEYHYQATIEGTPDRIVFRARGEAVTDVLACRVGFVVLHPIAGVSGEPLEVLHVDGSIERAHFPDRIDPEQPFLNVRALTHEVAPGVRVSCRMDGDTFEMEDHRNWTDASYKTYVRPLALPKPFRLAKGETNEQAVTLSVSARVLPAAGGAGPVRIAIGGVAGRVPEVGLQLDPDLEVAEHVRPLLAELAPAHLRCRLDLRRHDATALARAAAVARDAHAKLILDVVLPAQADPASEAQAVARAVEEAEATVDALIVSPAPDLQAIMLGEPPPACPPLEQVYAAMRSAFPGKPLGGGTYSFFTDLNREHPPTEKLDFVTHATCAIVHAADDTSVMETLESLPAIIASARAIAGGKGYHIGPGTIGLLHNPHAPAPIANPENARKTMVRQDPRQRGLLGAAWHLGYLARCAEAGVEAVTLAAPVGEFGVIYQPMPYAQPAFDQRGGVFPVFHVLRGIAREGGKPLREARSSRPDAVLALACESAGETVIWLANLGEAPQTVAFDGIGAARGAMLEVQDVRAAAHDRGLLDRAARSVAPGQAFSLGAYAVARLAA